MPAFQTAGGDMTLLRVLGVLLLLGGSASGQTHALSFGIPEENDLQSGDVHEHTLTAAAGDLVSGTLDVGRLAALVEILNSANLIVRTNYVSAAIRQDHSASDSSHQQLTRIACRSRRSTALNRARNRR
jgi:hypothetical protein